MTNQSVFKQFFELNLFNFILEELNKDDIYLKDNNYYSYSNPHFLLTIVNDNFIYKDISNIKIKCDNSDDNQKFLSQHFPIHFLDDAFESILHHFINQPHEIKFYGFNYPFDKNLPKMSYEQNLLIDQQFQLYDKINSTVYHIDSEEIFESDTSSLIKQISFNLTDFYQNFFTAPIPKNEQDLLNSFLYLKNSQKELLKSNLFIQQENLQNNKKPKI